MKATKKIIALMLISTISLWSFSGCYGQFALWHKLHKWNGTISEKWPRSVVHFVLWFIPVYGLCMFVDFLILNTVEFWSGSNPMAMAPGERETRIVKYNGEDFEITATRNRFDIKQLSGIDSGRTIAMIYNTNEESWSVESEGVKAKVMKLSESDEDHVRVVMPDGSNRVYDMREIR
ncbi:MAG: DUF3332 domain-containing protein [Spirochaetes bacterium]|jgi:hypothetical protein|nr:DUF3332 domain-containing protein [Spirochaetota bacterium]